MSTSISSVYMSVIEDVINNVRPDFEAENVDESVLNELHSLWELKVMQSGAVTGWILEASTNAGGKSGTIPATPVQDLNIPYEATEGYEMRPLTSTGQPVMYQYMPPGPDQSLYPRPVMNADIKIGKPAPYLQQPSPWMTKKLPAVDVNIAYEEGDEADEGGPAQPSIPKDFFALATGKRKREEVAPTYYPGSYIPQQDGASDSTFIHDSFATSRSFCQESQPEKDTAATVILHRRKELADTSNAFARTEAKGISQLDGIDDDYDDVTRSKNKWKCTLKDG